MTPRRWHGQPSRLGIVVVVALMVGSSWPRAQTAGEERQAGNDVYRIGVEDTLQLFVWQDSSLNLQLSVRPDGKVTVPLVGDVEASGKTTDELSAAIREELRRFIKDPVVTVVVLEINHMKVYVLGEVGNQGELVLRRPTRFLQVLAMAGGFTEFADRSRVLLIRTEDGKERRFELDYKKIVNGQRPADNVFVRPGDTIVVN